MYYLSPFLVRDRNNHRFTMITLDFDMKILRTKENSMREIMLPEYLYLYGGYHTQLLHG